MWAAQYLKFEEPNRWMTSGGLGTMGYGLPSAMGVQIAPSAIAGHRRRRRSFYPDEYSGTVDDHSIPAAGEGVHHQQTTIMGMVRQWQELLHGGRYAESYVDALPDFVKLAESFGAVGLRAMKPSDVDGVIGGNDRNAASGDRRYRC